ncbi:PEP/pyruvate-binding domain-containing protein [Streptomyces sp. DSM 44917]|uniref:PEP/pyruvate-binding domain-containing protein n=1 Tax=Streptomyces boetiae TaxID=3075541 RepID=A0ABU2L4T6_9ACTN|nr:PEP/pyruvate-binding domain-containing protein [Streptomyces sp. DSM 44917]MDT0306328.1 PEP/pyruvate-binding domain-containing protein [Streptomyces sp. DSM 44917]
MRTADIEAGGDSRTTPAGVALALTDPRARRAELTGGKAASLARAAAARLPVLPGFVILPPGNGPGGRDLREVWRELSEDGTRPLVVRSSSAAEDTAESSMAGRFASVLDVRGWEAFAAAVETVRASALAAGDESVMGMIDSGGGGRGDDGPADMAVLVQPMVTSRAGGVLFGADPVSGRADRMLLSAVRGGPDALVSGADAGTDARLTPHGRVVRERRAAARGLPLGHAELRRLAALARRARQVFGAPQDIEFGVEERTGRLWLFQSRPITAMAPRPARRARLLGPGPVAETLPGLLRPLEEDLWVVPMAHGLTTALDVGGAAARRTLRAHPAVTTVDGRAVADLALLGAAPRRRRFLAALNPLPPARRLAAAWRVGRLRASLPRLAAGLLADVDRELAEAPAPGELPPAGLVSALRWSRSALVSLHAQEALAGALLVAAEEERATAASAALAALHHGRAEGLTDGQLIAARPEVLALVPPSLTGPVRLPARGVAGTGPGTGSLGVREALRLRIRWVQAFQVALVREVAGRAGARRVNAGRLALLRWPELLAVAEGGPLPADFARREAPAEGPPLPDAFRLAPGGVVVAEPGNAPGAGPGAGARGVSGGRASGVAWDGAGEVPADAVLVVRHLDPALAPLLPGVAGLIAQTGSPLSHLAVLARELGLPVVTGAAEAVRRFPPGTPVLLDGTTGEVEIRRPAGAVARDGKEAR